MLNQRCIAIIPARGGSKRLPRKNVMDFHGKPILAWTIEAAKQAQCFQTIVVSSEDSEIQAIARRYGAEIHERSMELASDSATVAQVCEAVIAAEQNQGRDYDILACLYATAPMRTAEDIVATLQLLEHPNCQYAIATCDYTHYPFQALHVGQDNFVQPMWPELLKKRSSEIGSLVADNGSTYCVKVPVFLESKDFYGEGTRVHMMPFSRSVDIDNRQDYELSLKLSH
ncbi:cytidylyltransferase domain-containing protein [Moorena producens]|uniref:acylneuraminate cytidylyltransferase family protein n=1 Tax=Moorena producens TaxID=1155739 RepID=UPI003C719CC4